MAIKSFKPTTNARRGMTSRDTAALTTNKPHKPLTKRINRSAGRNNQGRITTRHRGGGVKRLYRVIDFVNRNPRSAKVLTIEYDPNRSAYISLIEDENGRKTYMIAPQHIKAGQTIQIGEGADVQIGNRLPLRSIPVGSTVHAIEVQPGKGAQMVRSAGTSAQLVAKEGDWAQIRMPSSEVRLIHLDCFATLGAVSNEQHGNVKIGSAGRNRRLGKRPSVRGKAMNPADHPMGGGEGLSGPGRHPMTPWGKTAIGLKTRRRKLTNKMIVRKRRARRG